MSSKTNLAQAHRYVVGNWKMHGDYDLAMQMVAVCRQVGPLDQVGVVICPPFPFLHTFADLLNVGTCHLGAQDCSEAESGARTGEVSAAMLAALHCRYVIVGHSERRDFHGEDDDNVANKAVQAQKNGLVPIVCVGETANERMAGQAKDKVMQQLTVFKKLDNRQPCMVAYEPVWAIGSGQVPSADDITSMHGFIIETLQSMGFTNLPVLYGGSVKPDNAGDIMVLAGVSGVLVGGASLDPGGFFAIAKAANFLP